MRAFPDFQLELTSSTDYVLASPLGRKALSDNNIPDLTNLLRDLMEGMDRLAKNCHLPEFTDHALPHICSLVKRLSVWGTTAKWLDGLQPVEATYLLLATLTHDLGMLSQDPAELENAIDQASKGRGEISDWVRRTHVTRLKGLLRRLLIRQNREWLTKVPSFALWTAIGMAHQSWPWESGFTEVGELAPSAGIDPSRAKGLAALVAVADLLDEDAARCDTDTLFKHRQGTPLNKAHWLRHGLTRDRLDVDGRKITIKFVNVPTAPKGMEQVFRALRNHFRLAFLYNDELAKVDAQIDYIDFNPCTGQPTDSNESLTNWVDVPEFRTCLPEQLLSTFMPEARNDVRDGTMQQRLVAIGLELVDLTSYRAFQGPPDEALTPEEQIFLSAWYA